MRSILPNEDQKQLLAAVGRVLSRQAGHWNESRSGNVLADLRSAKSALADMVGRGATNGQSEGPRVRKFWGWGYEGTKIAVNGDATRRRESFCLHRVNSAQTVNWGPETRDQYLGAAHDTGEFTPVLTPDF